MSRIIEAEARISARDATGSTFDKIAAKFKGQEKNAKALEHIKAPKFTGDMFAELKRLEIGEKNLQKVRKEMQAFDAQLKGGAFGQMRAGHYIRAMNDFKDRTVSL
ncbi:hypothetical protein [Bradyrhizobium sp. USDA 10063]